MKYTIGKIFPKNKEIDKDFVNELNNIRITSNPHEIDNAKIFTNCNEHMSKLIQSYQNFAA